MCGIAVLNKEADPEVTINIMKYLTKVRGGDGEGIAYFKTPNVTINKGTKQSPDESFDIMKNVKNDLIGNQFFYHTRKASRGPVIDVNVQPFKYNNNTAFCHNGTWIKSDDWARSLLINKDINLKNYLKFSDTKIILSMLQKLGFQFLDVVDSGVFIEFEKSQATVSLYSGNFEACKIDDLWYYASTFDKIHDDHVKFKMNTKAILKPDGFKIITGSTEERKDYKSTVHRRNYVSTYHGYTSIGQAIGGGGAGAASGASTTNSKDDASKKIKRGWKENNKGIITCYSFDGKPIFKYNKKTGKEIEIDETKDKPLRKNKSKRGAFSKREKDMIAAKMLADETETSTIEIQRNSNNPVRFTVTDAEKILENDKQLVLYKEIVMNCRCPVYPKADPVLELSSEDEATTLKAVIMRMIRDFNFDKNTIIFELGFTYYTPDIFNPYLLKSFNEIMDSFNHKKKVTT